MERLIQTIFITNSPVLQVAWALGIFAASVLVAWFTKTGIRWLQSNLQSKSASPYVSELWKILSRTVFILIAAEGFLLAIGSLSYLEPWRASLVTASMVVLIALVTFDAARSAGILVDLYLHVRGTRRKAQVDEVLARFLRRLIFLTLYLIGILVMLDYLNIKITPILAGLGIGGLAIALALQPTLGNFFASTQIISDRVVRIGDYIELADGDVKGYVTDIGWRSTRIRTPFNNVVVIPNSRMAESIITNYFGPTMEVGVIVNCGVSYSSDLVQVEQISLEVAKEVVQNCDEAHKKFEPWFGFDEFGDSNINFWIWIQAKDRLASFRLKSELIKRLKSRFDKEGITINYPVRHLLFEPDGSPLPPVNGRL